MKPYLEQKKLPIPRSLDSFAPNNSLSQPVSTQRETHKISDDQKEHALISATFANAELRTSKALSSYYANEALKLADVNRNLEAELARGEGDESLVAHFERKLAEAAAAQAELKSASAAALDACRLRAEAERAALQSRLDDQSAAAEALRGRVAALEEELRGVADLRDARSALRASVARLEADCAEAQAQRDREGRELRLALMEQRVRARADAQQAQEEAREEEAREEEAREEEAERQRGGAGGGREARRAAAENAALRRERALLLREGAAAEESAVALRRRNDALRRRAEIAAGVEAEAAAHGARQRREIAALRAQVRAAEDGLSAAAEQYERRLRAKEKTHTAEVKRLGKERDEALSAARVLRRDLVKLRGIARTMLERQTDMELFFHEALAHVRRKALQERRGGNATRTIEFGTNALTTMEYTRLLPRVNREVLMISDGGKEETNDDATLTTPKGALSLPPVLPNSHGLQSTGGATLLDGPFDCSGSMSIPTAPKMEDLRSVEISHLSWRDKERVLQRLFKKLQGRSKPKPFPYKNEVDELVGDVVAVDTERSVFITDPA